MTSKQVGAGSRIEPSRSREDKRLAVLEAAARIFNERGFHETSMLDVAVALGVSKPFLYYYVKDKEDLVFQCSRAATEQLHALLDQASESDALGWDRLRALFRNYMRVMTTDFGICLIRNAAPGNMASERHETLWAGRRRLNRQVEQLIAEAIADGSIRPCDPKRLSFALFGAFNWTTFWFRRDRAQSPEEIADEFLDIFFCGIGPASRTRRDHADT